MDLRAIRAATTPELATAAAAAARNADDLVHDAEILAEAHRPARACSLAALAVEEVGKAVGLVGLASMSEDLRARAPVGRILGWHQLKQVTGQLVAVVPIGPPGLAARLLDMPEDDLAQVLSTLAVPAGDADRLRHGGIYVDIGRGGQVREPSQITRAEVTGQLTSARQAASAVQVLLERDEQTRIAHPPTEELELIRAVVNVLTEAGCARTPQAAADAIAKMISRLKERLTGRSQHGLLLAA